MRGDSSQASIFPPTDWIRPADLRGELWRRQLVQAWGQWLSTFPWDHYLTLTFRGEVTVGPARFHFRRLVRRIEQRSQQAVYWFMAVEIGAGGRVHIHALFGQTERLAPDAIAEAWDRGRSEVARYDDRKGAAYYVSKAITSDCVDYDISPPRVDRLRSA